MTAKLRFKYSVPLFGLRGIVLYPFVLFSQSREDVSEQLFRHEMEHVYQVRLDGWLSFYFGYVFLLLIYGYKKHPFEVEAREYENDPLTDEERRLKDGS